MSDGYEKFRTFYQDFSGNQVVGTGTGDTTLKSVRNTSHTIFVQKVHVQVTGASAGKTWQLTDSASPVREVTGPFPTDTDGSHYDMDFGPEGVPLTEGKDLLLDVSAAGAAGIVTWEAYQKLTSVVAVGSA